jgi:hypothetical protein
VIHAASALYEDVAFIAFHFHWAEDDILDLEHARRRGYVEEIVRITSRAG